MSFALGIRERIAARPRRWLAVLASITVLLGAAAPFTRWDANPELLTIEGSPELATYRDYLQRFGSDELIIVAIEGPALLEPAGLATIRELTDAFAAIDDVEDVASLDTAYDVDFGPFGPFASPLVPDDLNEAPEPAELLARVHALPLTKDGLLDAAGTTTALTIKPDTNSLGGEARAIQGSVLAGVEAVLERPEFSELDAHLAGSPVFNRELERLNTRDNARFTPLAVAIVAVLLAFALRQFGAVALAMVCVGGTLAWVRGAMTLADVPFTTTTSLLPPLLMVLAVSVSVHVLARYQRKRAAGLGKKDAVDATLDAVLVPASLTALTTAVGFASLSVSPIPSVQTFGVFAALGVLAAFLLGGVALPAWLHLVPLAPRNRVAGDRLDRALIAVAGAARRRAPLVLGSAALVVAVALVFVPQLRVSTHDGEFFPDDHALNRAYDVIESGLAGVTPLELIVSSAQPNGIRTPEALQVLAELQDFLAAQPETIRGVSIADWLDVARRAIEPDRSAGSAWSENEIERAAFVLGAVSSRDLPYWVRDEWSTARISSRSVALDSEQNAALLARIEAFADDRVAAHPDLDVEVTGLVPVFAGMEEYLLESQIFSFSLALIAVFLVFVGLFRSVSWAALAMVPNVAPIVLTLGVMGASGIPLDVVTVMVASVNLGIVVDDTIHMIHAFRAARAEGLGDGEAMERSVRRTGRAVVFTSFVLSLGFISLAFSDFQPTAHFGALTALTVSLALLADLALLPALIARFGMAERSAKAVLREEPV